MVNNVKSMREREKKVGYLSGLEYPEVESSGGRGSYIKMGLLLRCCMEGEKGEK